MKRLLIIAALTLALGIGSYLVIDTFTQPTGTGQEETPQNIPQDARQVVPAGAAPPATAGTPLMGQVQAVDASTITLKNPFDGSVTSVELGADTPIYQDVEANRADLTPGAAVNIFSAGGEPIQAAAIHIGGGDMVVGAAPGGPAPLPGGPVMITRELDDAGGPPGAGQGDRFVPGQAPSLPVEALSGTVEALVGDILTLKRSDGSSVEVLLTGSTSLRKQQQVDTSALKQGATLMVMGAQDGARFKATRVEVLPELGVSRPLPAS